MKAVDGRSAASTLLAFNGRAENPVRKRASSKIKSAEEIILGTRSVDGRTRLPVDEKHVVAFAPPAVLILQNGHGDTEKVTTACGFHPRSEERRVGKEERCRWESEK